MDLITWTNKFPPSVEENYILILATPVRDESGCFLRRTSLVRIQVPTNAMTKWETPSRKIGGRPVSWSSRLHLRLRKLMAKSAAGTVGLAAHHTRKTSERKVVDNILTASRRRRSPLQITFHQRLTEAE